MHCELRSIIVQWLNECTGLVGDAAPWRCRGGATTANATEKAGAQRPGATRNKTTPAVYGICNDPVVTTVSPQNFEWSLHLTHTLSSRSDNYGDSCRRKLTAYSSNLVWLRCQQTKAGKNTHQQLPHTRSGAMAIDSSARGWRPTHQFLLPYWLCTQSSLAGLNEPNYFLPQREITC